MADDNGALKLVRGSLLLALTEESLKTSLATNSTRTQHLNITFILFLQLLREQVS